MPLIKAMAYVKIKKTSVYFVVAWISPGDHRRSAFWRREGNPSFSAKTNQILRQQDFLFLHKTALSLLKQKDFIVLHAPTRKRMSLFGAVNISFGKLVNLMTRFIGTW